MRTIMAVIAAIGLALILFFVLPSRQENRQQEKTASAPEEATTLPNSQEPLPSEESRSQAVTIEEASTAIVPQPANTTLGTKKIAIEESLEATVLGAIDPTAIITNALAVLGDKVGKPDLEYWDEQVTAFPVEMPKGMQAHLLVGRDKFERGGRELRDYEIRLEIEAPTIPWLSNGAAREGYRVDIGVSRDADGNAQGYSLFTVSKVMLGESRKLGIDAYHGKFTEGIFWIYDPNGSFPTFCRSNGIVDGHHVQAKDFDAKPPSILGEPTKELLEAWNAKVSKLLKEIK